MSILSSIRFGGRRLNGNESRNFDGSSKILIFNINPNLCYFDLKKKNKVTLLTSKNLLKYSKNQKKRYRKKTYKDS